MRLLVSSTYADVFDQIHGVGAVLSTGTLDRKCLVEGGKDSKKRAWHTYYAALAGRTLYFFKDEKEKRKGKKPQLFFQIAGTGITHINIFNL